MSDKRRDIRKAKRTPGESAGNARERARVANEQATRRKKERKVLIFAAVGLLAIALIVGVGIQLSRFQADPESAAKPANGFAAVNVQDGVPIKLGKPEAKTTLTVYSDFLCSHCQDFEEAFSETIRKHQDDGSVTLESVPMSFIDPVISASMTNAFACAVDQGVGQEYYAGLFENKSLQWTDEQLVALGKQIKPDMSEEFNTCVSRKKNQSFVESMTKYAGEKGVESTPTIFLEGEKVELAGLTPQKLDQMIAEAAGK